MNKHAHVTYGNCTVHFDANGGKFADEPLDATRFIDFGAQFIFDD